MYGPKRQLKDRLKLIIRKFFECGQQIGVDVLPRHFYSEIPSIKELKRSGAWKTAFSMTGVTGADPEDQIAFVNNCCPPAMIEKLRAGDIHGQACTMNGETGFGPTEADFLFAYIAQQQPKQIVQIGCGVSTAICLLASEHAGYHPEIICIEPYPTSFLMEQSTAGKITLVQKKAEAIDLAFIESLSSDLLFFVDSSHTLGPAGEVSRIILEMLPRLKGGATIHFHDIYFPYDYSPDILDSSLFFWHESVLLHAFLCGNSRFCIQASLSMLHHARQKQLVACLPNYHPAECEHGILTSKGHFPASTYLRIEGDAD